MTIVTAPAEAAEYVYNAYKTAVGGAEGTPYGYREDLIPQDIQYVGEGCFRRVFAYGGWVIKVNKYRDRFSGNTAEYNNYLHVKDKVPEGFAVPETHLVRIGEDAVIVMEYVEGVRATEDEHDDEALEYLHSAIGLSDVHNENIIMRDGVKVIVDLGC